MDAGEPRVRRRGFFLHSPDSGEPDTGEHENPEGFVVRVHFGRNALPRHSFSGGRMTYNAVKAAEISLGKAMAQQLARDNIRVNSVAPGSIRFPGGSWDRRVQADPAGMAEFVRRELPFGRFGRPEEVGAVVAFLVSPRASWISGASVPVDGCQSRSPI